MTFEDFRESYIENCNEFAYWDSKYCIGMYYLTDDGKVTCCLGPDDDGILIDSMEDVLDKFIINGRPFREILPEIDENRL